MNEVYCIACFNTTDWNKVILSEKLKELQSLNKEEWCEMYVPTLQIFSQYANGSAYDFTFIEKFKSKEDFNSHCEQEYVKKFFEENKELIFNSNITLHSEIWN